ncbi:MAG: hypothetical protein WCP97_04940 [bacterium]
MAQQTFSLVHESIARTRNVFLLSALGQLCPTLLFVLVVTQQWYILLGTGEEYRYWAIATATLLFGQALFFLIKAAVLHPPASCSIMRKLQDQPADVVLIYESKDNFRKKQSSWLFPVTIEFSNRKSFQFAVQKDKIQDLIDTLKMLLPHAKVGFD